MKKTFLVTAACGSSPCAEKFVKASGLKAPRMAELCLQHKQKKQEYIRNYDEFPVYNRKYKESSDKLIKQYGKHRIFSIRVKSALFSLTKI